VIKDVLIIGQGLAGTILAFELIKRGLSVHLIDDQHASASSMVDIATINPVTGRRYAKSWNIDTLIPYATETYKNIEQKLGKQYLSGGQILQVLPDSRVEEIWMLRAADPEFSEYLDDKTFDLQVAGLPLLRCAEIKQARHLLVSDFLKDCARWFLENAMITHDAFEHGSMEFGPDQIKYKGSIFKHIIFCTGYGVTKNPLFKWLEVIPMKGEYLICRIPGLELNQHLKSGISIIPMPEQETYWCGSTYDRYNENPSPTMRGQKSILRHLEQLIKGPINILHHGAGIRATTRDRRPYIGSHPEYGNVHIVTGLGTKGASLTPYGSTFLADLLTEGKTIPAEIDALRYFER